MRIDRRTFLGAAGVSALAVAAGSPARGLVEGKPAKRGAPARPAPRWAMVVDLRRCLRAGGCTDCISACHAAHNVPDIPDRPREVKWIWKEPFARVFPEQVGEVEDLLAEVPVPILCNHCERPPCVRVCPTQATWRRADGIVMMDWHRCIGCRYCVAACPYGSRSFNWVDPRPHLGEVNAAFPNRTRGVVEKCTFCQERLAEGLPPACVEACPERAMTFGDLGDPESEVRRLLRRRRALRRRPELGTRPQVFYLL